MWRITEQKGRRCPYFARQQNDLLSLTAPGNRPAARIMAVEMAGKSPDFRMPVRARYCRKNQSVLL